MANQVEANALQVKKKTVSSRMNGQTGHGQGGTRFTTQELTQTIIATF